MLSCESGNRCRICKKLFCCVECRERHETKKHPERVLNCPLCASQKFPLRTIEDKALLCHIIINHLPLYCYLCGDKFETSADLEKFEACRWYGDYHSLLGRNPLLATPCSASVSYDVKKKEQSTIERICNINYESLTSPPELHRTTSTPMHVNLICQKTELQFKTPKVPTFTLKTPKTDSPSTVRDISVNLQIADSRNSTASNYFTLSPCELSHETTPFRTCTQSRTQNVFLLRTNPEKVLHVMQEQDERIANLISSPTEVNDDMDLTSTEGGILCDSQKIEVLHNKPEKKAEEVTVKKVRFSDQYVTIQESTNSIAFSMTENEEFFEARDVPFDIQLSSKEENSSSENTFMRVNHNNEKNIEKENYNFQNGNNCNKGHQQSIGSRVLMMVVVENNQNLTSSDLGPLIDSGLKQLQQATSASSIASSVLTEANCNSPNGHNLISESVNSYISMSSVSSTTATDSMPTFNHQRRRSLSESSKATNSGGLFSAVAHAVRSAFKTFSGTTNALQASSYEDISQRESIYPLNSEQNSSLPNLASSLPCRPGKRPRDDTENSSPLTRLENPVTPHVEVNSPLAKRQRGWCRIKAREPIARMRNNIITSPKRISSETQVFSQGSLSVGNTVLPLPARAHKSTQTE